MFKFNEIKILIIENNEFEAVTIKHWLLQEKNIEISKATNIKTAKELLSKNNFEIIISADMVKGQSTIKLLKEEKERNNTVSIILMLNLLEQEKLLDIFELSPDDIIVKPLTGLVFQERFQRIKENLKNTYYVRKFIENKETEKSLFSIDILLEKKELSKKSKQWLKKTKVELLLKENKNYEAEIELEASLKHSVFNIEEIRLLYLQSLYKQHKLKLIIKKSNEFLQINPYSIETLLYQGKALYELKELEKAEKIFFKALQLTKNKSLEAKRKLSKIAYENGDFEKAIFGFKEILKKDPDCNQNDLLDYINAKKEFSESFRFVDQDKTIDEILDISKTIKEKLEQQETIIIHEHLLEIQKINNMGDSEQAKERLTQLINKNKIDILKNESALINALITSKQMGFNTKLPMSGLIRKDRVRHRFNAYKNINRNELIEIENHLKRSDLYFKESELVDGLRCIHKAIDINPESISLYKNLLDEYIKFLNKNKSTGIILIQCIKILKKLRELISTNLEEKTLKIYVQEIKKIMIRDGRLQKEK